MRSIAVEDFKKNDCELEYIGKRPQQMGVRGFIAQIQSNRWRGRLRIRDRR